MRILTDLEFNSGPFPSPEEARAWRDDPVTERMFNVFWRLVPGAGSSEFKDGFRSCKDSFLDFMNSPEVHATEPKARTQPMPKADYDSDKYLKQREAELRPDPVKPAPIPKPQEETSNGR